ncbi:MAG TPA: CHAD domain-containing protein [Burkholderiales bacterium]|nr:CHAD domain-containing protein [Burkholderiales bacterium]
MTEETELKLSATPRTLSRLASDPLLGKPKGAPQSLIAIYFDTPRFSLWRQGIVLRLRRESGRWVQTVKGRGALVAGVHRRIESTSRARSAVPDLERIPDAGLRKQVAAIIGAKRLVPIFRVEVLRETRIVSPAKGSQIEVSIDRGAIVAGNSRVAVSEVELELKAGPAWRLFELALAVSQRYAARLAHRSKAQHGYELAGAIRAAPVRASMGVVHQGMTASEAFNAICVTCLNHLQANQPGVLLGEDPEYLHQARVALRRLHSGFDAFRRIANSDAFKSHAKSLRQFTRALGPARDWDVFAGQTLAPVMEQFPGHRGLGSFERACSRLRAEAGVVTRRLFASRRYQSILLGLGGWLAQGHCLDAKDGAADAREHAGDTLERCYKRVLKRAKKMKSLQLRRLHRLRIAAKKLRYAAGFFSPLYPRRRAQPMHAALNDLQDLLGAINDCASAPEMIEACARAARGPQRAQARTIIDHWNSAVLEERRRELSGAWDAFEQAKCFWR